MASKTYYERGDTFVDVDNKPAIVKKGNQLIFTDDFKAGGGELAPATANALGGVKIGNGVNVTSDGTISVPSYTPPAYSETSVNTGKKWIDGRDIWVKTIVFVEPVNVTTSYTTIESDTDVDVPISANAIDPTYKACMPLKAGVESSTLKVIAFDAQFTAETITVEYLKQTPVEPENNTRTVKKIS